MTIYKFSKEDSLELLEAAVSRDQLLTIVKDTGAYLMVTGSNSHPQSNHIVKYLTGMNPSDQGWWHECQLCFGTEDLGVEVGAVSWFKHVIAIKEQWESLRIQITQTHFNLSVK